MHRVSVVIPTLNRAEMLASTIDRIERQTVSRESYEVLVVNNNSSDHTKTVLKEKAAAYPNLRSFNQAKPGAAARCDGPAVSIMATQATCAVARLLCS